MASCVPLVSDGSKSSAYDDRTGALETARDAAHLIGQNIQSWTFVALLVIDCLLISTHVYIATSPWEDSWSGARWLRLDRDRSFAEFYEYAKLLAAGGLVWLMVRNRFVSMLPVGLAILYMFMDNAFELHEAVGMRLAPALPVVGQIIFFATCGVTLFGLGALSYLKSSQFDRVRLLAIGGAIIAIAIFGVGLDAISAAFVAPHGSWKGLFALVEDGGEMLGLSLLLTIVLHAAKPASAPYEVKFG